MDTNRLVVEDVTVTYGKVTALKGVSINVAEGEAVALIGSNGAGKTTLVRTISGLEHPASGSIFFENRQIDALEPHEITRLGIAQVPEGRHVFNNLKVWENLQLGALTCIHRYKQSLGEIMNLFPVLAERKSQVAGTLSGGERQLLAIGRGLMSNPKILILDEPSLGLSPYWVEQIKNIIDNLKRKKIGLLIIEQNAELAFNTTERGYVLELGKISLQGSAGELRKDERVLKAYLGLGD